MFCFFAVGSKDATISYYYSLTVHMCQHTVFIKKFCQFTVQKVCTFSALVG
jgi:hypothetical protein